MCNNSQYGCCIYINYATGSVQHKKNYNLFANVTNIFLWSFHFNEVIYLAKYAKVSEVKISNLIIHNTSQ